VHLSKAKIAVTAPLKIRARGQRGVIWASRARRGAAPALGIATLLILTAWVFRRQLFDHWSFPWDFLGSYSTTPAFVAATIGRGHPLSWSPFVASGFPVDTDLQAGVYFPVWWALGALRVTPTLGVLTGVQILHVPLGAIGVMLLARARRQAWPWAVVAAVAYVFFGGFYGQAEHADIFRGFAYLPWLLWAMTPPEESRAWTRLAAVPPLAWLIVTGAYAGQAISFAIAGLVYLGVALRVEARSTWRQHRVPLLLMGIAAIAVSVAIVLPYLRADQAGELIRTDKPTAAFRSMFALSPLDAFGLYLNNFAWTFEGTVTTWAIGIPILVGLACARRETLARQAPLVACGAVALTLAMLPKIDFIGRGMTSLGPLFTSRFPAADYKAIVALVFIILSVDAWSRVSARDRRSWIAIALAAGFLVSGILLAPRAHAQPTRELWLAAGVILASCLLALTKPSPRMLACALVVLIAIDGAREINDYLLGGQVSPWQDPPSELAYYRQRDEYVRELPALLAVAPQTRPARVAASPTPEVNASGWVAEGYRATDYDPVRERALWEAEANPDWLRLLLSRWLAVTFPCTAVGCSAGAVHLPSPRRWHASTAVHTVSYGADRIVYSVAVSQPTLMVENELAVAGWHANTDRVEAVKSGTPLRAWRLSPGTYRFTASFQEPGRSLQWSIAILALIAWIGCLCITRRRPTVG
jgi:hydrogenase/urease accessory protein HupE